MFFHLQKDPKKGHNHILMDRNKVSIQPSQYWPYTNTGFGLIYPPLVSQSKDWSKISLCKVQPKVQKGIYPVKNTKHLQHKGKMKVKYGTLFSDYTNYIPVLCL